MKLWDQSVEFCGPSIAGLFWFHLWFVLIPSLDLCGHLFKLGCHVGASLSVLLLKGAVDSSHLLLRWSGSKCCGTALTWVKPSVTDFTQVWVWKGSMSPLHLRAALQGLFCRMLFCIPDSSPGEDDGVTDWHTTPTTSVQSPMTMLRHILAFGKISWWDLQWHGMCICISISIKPASDRQSHTQTQNKKRTVIRKWKNLQTPFRIFLNISNIIPKNSEKEDLFFIELFRIPSKKY